MEDSVTQCGPLIRHKGFWIRGDANRRLDEFAVKERSWDKLIAELVPEDVLLDGGAYIGTVARRAAEAGASVVSYEPAPHHLPVLRKNVDDTDVAVVPAALTTHSDGATLFLSKKSGMSHSLISRRRPQIEARVPTVSFAEELDRIEPTAIKLDIEGSEYELLDDLATLPSRVRLLGLEFHLIKRPGYLKRAETAWGVLELRGWKPIHGPRLAGAWKEIYEVIAVRESG